MDVTIAYESPFNLTQEELVALAHSKNPVATLISEENAIEMVHKDKTPEERKQIAAKIKAEKKQSELDNPSDITL